jgi:thiol-disulfide isomerase/thioredoxin
VTVLAVARHASTAGYDTSPKAFVLPSVGTPGKVRLADFHGHPVVVNFFASWCTQCAAELPAFDADARALRGNVDFVEINALETGNGRMFADRFNLAASVAAVAHDVGGSQGDGLYEALGGNGSMPMTAFYGPDGSLLSTHTGSFDAASLAGVLQQLYNITVTA